MQKVLTVWIDEGRDIDEEKFWNEVDHNRQFTHPIEYYRGNFETNMSSLNYSKRRFDFRKTVLAKIRQLNADNQLFVSELKLCDSKPSNQPVPAITGLTRHIISKHGHIF